MAIRISDEGLKILDAERLRRGWTRKELADHAGLAEATVAHAFNNKKYNISENTVQAICDALGIPLKEITLWPPINDKNPQPSTPKDQILDGIKKRCGEVRVLDLDPPRQVEAIYTSTSFRKLSSPIPDLMDRTEVVKAASPMLMVIGGAGTGKTMFLKYLAMLCGNSKKDAVLEDGIPIVVTLKDFSEAESQPTLKDFIARQWSASGIENAQELIEQYSREKQLLVLLDGLSEVSPQSHKRVCQEIQSFSKICHRLETRIIITSRFPTGNRELGAITTVEIVGFSHEEIKIFIRKFFGKNQDLKVCRKLIEKLNSEDSLKELTSNPLLLTLFCRLYDKYGDLPVNKIELYKKSTEVLLRKISSRDGLLDSQWPWHRKEHLFGFLALETFQTGNYSFDESLAKGCILKYVQDLTSFSKASDLKLFIDDLWEDIKTQSGLIIEKSQKSYSFSYLIFHEYFTAQEIVGTQNWDLLSEHSNDKRWREVTLLAGEEMRYADSLLLRLKSYADDLLGEDSKLQTLLKWVNQHAKKITLEATASNLCYVARAFSLATALKTNLTAIDLHLERAIDLHLERAIDLNIFQSIAPERNFQFDINLDVDLAMAIAISLELDVTFQRQSVRAKSQAFALAKLISTAVSNCKRKGQCSLTDELKKLYKDIQHFEAETWQEYQPKWWRENGSRWIKMLRYAATEYRGIGQDWQFTPQQQQKLRQYYDANLLLVECLNRDCRVSLNVRQEIEETLLLPIADIQRRHPLQLNCV